VTRRPTGKIAAYTGVAALALLAGLALGRPELVAVAAPLAVLVVAGLTGTRDPQLDARVSVDRERALVGDEVTVELALRAATRIERLEVLLVVPPGMDGQDGGPGGSSLAPRRIGGPGGSSQAPRGPGWPRRDRRRPRPRAAGRRRAPR
jgi:uncharacterized protein (DUF58 family)